MNRSFRVQKEMKLLCLLVLIAATTASFHDVDFAGRIENGLNAVSTDDFAFRFLSVEDINADVAKVSTGVAITTQIGLVVALAVDGFEFFYIGFGSINVADHGIQRIPKDNIIIHNGFDPLTLLDNIAVLKFTTPVINYVPVATGLPDFPVRLVFGYGFINANDQTISDSLQQLIIVEASAVGCVGFYPEFDAVSSLCNSFPVDSAFTYGDQGGPIVDINRNSVLGLVSYWGLAGELLVGVNLLHYTAFIDASIATLLL